MNLDKKARQLILQADPKELEQTIRFFTHCCKHCKMADLSCSASMMCMCHSEQVDEIIERIPRWRKQN